jgi:hypothetical protein
VSRPDSSVQAPSSRVRTKSERIELRASPRLRAQLDELASLRGTDVSTIIRQLVTLAHSEAFAACKGVNSAEAPEPRQGPVAAQHEPVASEPSPWEDMSTDEILAAAGIDLGPALE